MKRSLALLSVLVLLLANAADANAEDGPHGGALYQGGNHKWHAELVQNSAAKTVTVHILDGKAKKEVPIAAKSIAMNVKGHDKPFTVPADGGADGKTATYKLTHRAFTVKLDPKSVSFLIEIDGKEMKFELDDD